MTTRELLKKTEEILEKAEIPGANEEARLIYEAVTDCDLTALIGRENEDVTPEIEEKILKIAAKRAEHYPLQYLVSQAWFYGRCFLVNENVLIPRFDTEVLVYEALSALKKEDGRVLDLCTGSGIIGITLKLEGVKGEVILSDISEGALSVADRNRKKLGADVKLVQSDLFTNIDGDFCCIVSNPPYIKKDVILTLDPEVKDHEPMLALDGGEDGLDFYRVISKEAYKRLTDGGKLFLEIGDEQGKDVTEILKNDGFTKIRIIKDLAGLDRVAAGVKEENV